MLYSSLESVIEQNKEGYYRALRQTQGSICGNDPNSQLWVLYFLNALQGQKTRLAKKIERERITHSALPELSVQILEMAKAHGKVTISQISDLTKANRNTVKIHLRALVSAKHLSQHGTGRGTWYSRVGILRPSSLGDVVRK